MPLETFKATAHLQKGMVVKAKSRNFEITVDEPKYLGGTDTGMNPVELVLCALGACQAIVARVYAPKFKIRLEEFWVEVEGDLDTDGFMNKSDVRRGYSDIRYNIHMKSNASREQAEEFVQFIERTCPVGDTIINPVNLVLNKIILE
ncbi:OsmC family protein [Paenibacillus profundus]|uniref:OsmC family protein n=1 Tax=Paenibacillus profundus TaxID=1173085 RepID=A0ABS8YLN9_9BACL|nr:MULTISPECIES: OsmC family protein [Paenibacillus]MCE5171859.1 OsmC family protein [Paenibacillus profundus]MCM3341140.1 OsmC family protein [Paenibacillus sp. MER TA 81-3]